MTTLRILLDAAVDYAGLFPPAGLDMRRAVENYRSYLRDPAAWMLGRFVLPAARLAEFEDARGGGDDAVWRLSVLVGEDPRAADIASFNAGDAGAIIDSVETKAFGEDGIDRIAKDMPAGVTCFVELDAGEGLEDRVAALAGSGLNAKIRTGGVTAEMIPATETVASFIAACRDRDVPFKATAGLHHPIRAVHRLTYEPDSASGKMLGFLNVFLATVLAWQGADPDTIRRMLEEEDAAAIAVTDESITWRNRPLDRAAIQRARDDGIRSFGSCSFEEPVADLKGMHLL